MVFFSQNYSSRFFCSRITEDPSGHQQGRPLIDEEKLKKREGGEQGRATSFRISERGGPYLAEGGLV